MDQIYQYIRKMNRHFAEHDNCMNWMHLYGDPRGVYLARAKWHNDQGQWYKAALESVDVKLENDHRGLFQFGGFK